MTGKTKKILSFILAAIFTFSVHQQQLQCATSSKGLNVFWCPYLPQGDDLFSFYAKALFFKPYENGLAYGMVHSGAFFEDSILFEENGTFSIETRVKSPKFTWNTGFRVGVGYQPRCSPVELALHWMHYHTTGSDQTRTVLRGEVGSVFVDTFSGFYGIFPFNFFTQGPPTLLESRAKVDLTLRCHLTDVEVAYEQCFGSCLTIKPKVGCRLAFIDQGFKIDFHAKTLEEILGINLEFTTEELSRLTNDFTGVGVLCGVDGTYKLGWGVSCFGSICAALLKGHFDVRQKYRGSFSSPSLNISSSATASQKERLCLQRTMVDLSLGLQWTLSCHNGCTSYAQLAWEQHHYFGQNQISALSVTKVLGIIGVTQANRGDLGLQGVSLLLGFDF